MKNIIDCIRPYVFWICQHHVIDTDDIRLTPHVLPQDILKEKSRHWQVMIRLDPQSSSCNLTRGSAIGLTGIVISFIAINDTDLEHVGIGD